MSTWLLLSGVATGMPSWVTLVMVGLLLLASLIARWVERRRNAAPRTPPEPEWEQLSLDFEGNRNGLLSGRDERERFPAGSPLPA